MLHIVGDIFPGHFGEGPSDHRIHWQGLLLNKSLQPVLLVQEFEFGEAHFDWIELRAVNRIPNRLNVELLHHFHNWFGFVDGQVVNKEGKSSLSIPPS